jgi:preprotein translocase subunit SecF
VSLFHSLSSYDDTIDFRRVWRVGFVISAVLVIGSILAIGVRGINLGIDFEGGTSWDVPSARSVEDTRDVLRPLGEAGAKIIVVGRGDARLVRVQSATVDEAAVAEVAGVLAEHAGTTVEDISISSVGPSWGDEITAAAQRALIFFFIAIGLYISIRLEWKMAIGALASIVHDIVISVGFYAALQLEITPATVIAFLTILGYSLYDTIVVYDRVQTNTDRITQTAKRTYTDAVSLSLNQVLMRSINTSVTSLIPVVSLLFIGSFVLGATTLQEFAIALAVGMAVGAYSSIFVAAPVLAWVKEREPAMAELRKRVAARGGPVVSGRAPVVAPVGAGAPAGTSPVDGETAPRGPTAPVPSGRPIPPRPRKKGKRR